MRTYMNLAVILIAIIFHAQSVGAQSVNCGVPYAPTDRAALRSYLVDDIRVMATLERLHGLATWAQFEGVTDTQRLALDSEFQALINHLTVLGSTNAPGFRPRTTAWLDRIVDSQFLGLIGSHLQTKLSAEAAFWVTVAASRRFYLCY